jgi:hypothetical protein
LLAQHLVNIHQVFCKPIQEICQWILEDPERSYTTSVRNDRSTAQCPVQNCLGKATAWQNMKDILQSFLQRLNWQERKKDHYPDARNAKCL